MSQEIACPQCRAVNDVPDSAIGSYFSCKKCKCLFWIVVPPLEEPAPSPLRETLSPARSMSANEPAAELDPTAKTLMRQEALLFTMVQEMRNLRRTLMWFDIGVFVALIACFATIAMYLK